MATYKETLASRDYNFSATVTDFVAATQLRMTALAMQSTQDLIEEVQTPVGKGGNMPLDTGFLRASGQVSLTGMPSGPVRGDPDKEYEWDIATAIAEFAGFELGKTIFFGWTANYAAIQEARRGFLIAGVQNWQSIVNRNCALIAAQSPANKGAQ